MHDGRASGGCRAPPDAHWRPVLSAAGGLDTPGPGAEQDRGDRIPRFGGAGETIYGQELRRLRDAAPATAEDYETLNSLSDDIDGFASDVIQLVERLVTPRSVFTIMSFDRALRDVFDSFKEVCEKFNFEAERTDESVSLERILPRIENGIRHSAFVIADVSEVSPNVFYEVGYARALGKDVILTARRGTELPFDILDVPTIFWEDQRELKERLHTHLAASVGRYGRTTK